MLPEHHPWDAQPRRGKSSPAQPTKVKKKSILNLAPTKDVAGYSLGQVQHWGGVAAGTLGPEPSSLGLITPHFLKNCATYL